MNSLLSSRGLCVLAGIAGSVYGQATGGVDLRRPGRAADGVISIDQSAAAAGGVTPGDSSGFPVTISASGSYRLTGNLTVPDLNTTAIEITADFVTLDLNGFGIVGPAVCTTGAATSCGAGGSGVGIRGVGAAAAGPRGIRVLNGAVRGMGLIGIQLSGRGSSVDRVTVDGNAGGGMTVAGAVTQSAATQNGSFGIIATAVRDSTALENAGDGIIISTEGGVAIGNVSSVNGGLGIALQLGTATANTLFLNREARISAVCPSSIVNNTIVTNGAGNIKTSGEGCVMANNGTRQ